MKTERLFLVDIVVADRLRAVSETKVSALKASIAEIGLRTPVTVSATPDGNDWSYRLVAGAHRLEALRQLGEEFADCFVMEGDDDDAALWEIDENFARAELTDAQRADHHVRREEIMIRKGLVKDAPKGGRPGNLDKLSKYSAQAASEFGVDERTIRRDLARGKKIDADVLAEVSGTDLDKGVVLDELASTPKPDQRAKLAEIAERRSTVRPAPDPLNDPEAHEKQLSGLMSAWNRAAAVVRQEFLLRIEEPVFDNTSAGAS